MLVVKGQFCYTRPLILAGRTSDREDFHKLVSVVLTCKERCSVNNLCENASDWPDVDGCCVIFWAKQNIWSTVPQSDDFVSEIFDRDTERSSQTEISKLQEPLPVDQKILGLQISMQNFVPVAFFNAVQELVQVFL